MKLFFTRFHVTLLISQNLLCYDYEFLFRFEWNVENYKTSYFALDRKSHEELFRFSAILSQVTI